MVQRVKGYETIFVPGFLLQFDSTLPQAVFPFFTADDGEKKFKEVKI